MRGFSSNCPSSQSSLAIPLAACSPSCCLIEAGAPPGRLSLRRPSAASFQRHEACCLRVTERNKRSVWTVPSKGYREAHFATYPPDLIRPCVLAGCPVSGVVLDPFGGSGTTGEVCEEEGAQ